MLFEVFTIAALMISVGLVTNAIWSRKQTVARGLAVLTFLCLIPTLVGVGFFAMSHPAPWFQSLTVLGGDYFVLGVKLVQDKAIYVWLDFGKEHPRYFELPWDNETANKVQELMDRQQRGDGDFVLKIPYERSLDRNALQFHPLPQPKVVPDKPPQREEPKRYERSI